LLFWGLSAGPQLPTLSDVDRTGDIEQQPLSWFLAENVDAAGVLPFGKEHPAALVLGWLRTKIRQRRKPMSLDITEERLQAHALLDSLPADKLHAVRNLMEVMIEPLARSLALAPFEEEELTPGTVEALQRAKASLARGEGIRHEEVLSEFGLSE
jgi:hypothetical protein